MRTHTPWSLAAVLSLATLGLVGCEGDRDLRGLLQISPPADTSERSAGVPPESTTPTPMATGGGPTMGAGPAMTTASAQGCVMDDAAKTAKVLAFVHATNRSEMVLAKLAIERAKSEPIKAQARIVMRDHTDLDEKLQALAKREGIDLEPAIDDPILMGLNAVRDAHLAKLVTKTGESFDMAYVGPEVSEHRLASKIVEQGEKSAKGLPVQAYLAEAHAVLQRHETQAMKLHDDVMLPGAAKAAPKAIGGGPMTGGATGRPEKYGE
jgi:predicted outer membrane protein